ASLDRRTRAQRMLDGIIGACKIALSSGTLPAAGGLRPQILVTIGYKELLADLNNTTTDANGMTGTSKSNTWTSGSSTCVNDIASIDINRAGSGTGTSGIAGAGIAGAGINRAGSGSGVFAFTGPVSAAVIRKMACDAELLPVVMGTEGQILDIGRASRVFPPHIRKAITARDLGCAFPGCTMPAPWCEAHHITYWSHGGTTSTSNGTLLCSHHHLIHKEHWQIQVQNDIPWFIPPPHIDPQRKPRRNHYFRQ
ncbi:HNH endonuclease signature motif containing protein, partial [Arthrobacter sp. ISL-30]|uniref:HNH endonuclease signature motif containing protein n=1 Tax=Arthrobacter sp. ISL-30 TaxID=2819109 RepID=UPI0020356CDB